MSNVTNLLVHLALPDEDKIEEINKFFDEKGLVALDSESLPVGWYGGSKYLECCLFVGAFNYFDLLSFLNHCKKLKLKYPKDFQIFIQEQEDTKFYIIEPF